MDSVIEYSLDGGVTWQHGRTVEAWVAEDRATLAQQRAVVRDFARQDHGNVEQVTTRVLPADDPRGVLNQPAPRNSGTPLADALAGVDHAQGPRGGFGLGPARELAALRDLAEAVRAHLIAHPESQAKAAD